MQLSCLYQKLLCNHKDWFYNGLKDFSLNDFDDQSKCLKILRQLLNHRKKDDFTLYRAFFSDTDEKLESRARHVLSCYCLGKILYDNSERIREAVNKFIGENKLDAQDGINAFRYLWMLICLFHDLGYAYEIKKIASCDNIPILLKELPESSIGIPDIYTKELLSNYYKYRTCRFSVKDHGLTGGALLFKDLNKYIKKKSFATHQEWREKVHSCVSWVIACHNVFYSRKGDDFYECYECFSLDDLCKEDKPRNITLDEHPLLFLFCLVDSIEPLKTFGCVEELKSVNVEFSPESLTISVDMHCNGKKLNYLRKIQSLNDWLTDVEDLSIKL